MSRDAAGRPTSRRGGSGPAGRLAFLLFLLAALVTLLSAAYAEWVVRSVFEREAGEELERMRAAAGRERDRLGDRAASALRDLERHLIERRDDVLGRVLHGGAGAWDVAPRLMHVTPLDGLEILDAQGNVLSSATWANGQFLRAALPSDGSDRFPALRLFEEAGRNRLAVVAREDLSLGGQTVVMLGAKSLDAEFLDRVAVGEVAWILDRAGSALVASTRAGAEDRTELLERWRNSPGSDESRIVADRQGHRWSFARFPLTDRDGAQLGAIVVATDRRRLGRMIAGIRRGSLVVAGVAGLLSALAGLWIARGVSKPVRDLVRAFDAIDAGEADYDFPSARGDDLQELVGSFSRLHRSLEVQRERVTAAERVATWRDVARHVAHEVKNPLAPIRLTVENLVRARREAPDRFDAMFREGARTILEEVERLRKLVDQFSTFAKLPTPSLEPGDLERVVGGALDLFAATPGIEIRRRFAGNLPPISLDADQISGAVKNVVGNAVEAMGRSSSDGESHRLVVRTAVEEGMALVEITDNGPGFSEEALRRIFEPYFTTKQEGTGLGMALTYRVIVEHGGVIRAENLPGGGGRVTMRLPLGTAAKRSGGASE